MTSASTSDENKMADSTTTTSNSPKTTEMTSVSQFYTDKCIFITGGTGFMGKVLVEKLVRSCPGIKNIYLLIRPKRGQDVSTRLNELLNAPLFDKLRQERPTDLNKIVPIVGDITEPELGISPSDQALLCRNISIVFHSAATVKFDEKLRLSVTINMLGTKRLVQLCHRMLSLEALIHVSTAYCNCDRYEVNEVIYAPPYDPDHIMNLVEWLTEDLIDVMTPSLIGKRPNTYTFTKALTEHMLQKEAGNLPVAIVRPSIVLSSHHEPLSGWVDNWNGPTGIISAVGKGFYRTIICHENKVADLVPVDTVINLMVVAAWRTASQRKDGSDGGRGITVYNCCTGQQKPVTWKKFVETSIEYMIKHPFEGAVWYPTGTLRKNYYTNAAVSLAVHWLPAYVLDGISKIMGKRPIMVRVQDKLGKAVHCLEYFTTQEWQFRDDNVKRLNAILSPSDKKVFPFDVNDINWDSYIESYILGVRQFMFKEKLSSLPKARQQMSRLYWVHQLSKILIVLMTWRFLIAKSNKFRNIWYSLTELLVRIARMVPFV